MSVIKDQLEHAAVNLAEVFSDFIIVGLPIDRKELPVQASHGDPAVIADLLQITTHMEHINIESPESDPR